MDKMHSDIPYSEPPMAAGAGDAKSLFGSREVTPRSSVSQMNNQAAGRSSLGCRKYHMESDIFGNGLTPSQPSQRYKTQYAAPPIMDPAMKGSAMGAAGRPTVVQNMDWFGRDEVEHPSAPARRNEMEYPPGGHGLAEYPPVGRGEMEYPSGGQVEFEHPSIVRDRVDYQNNFEDTQSISRGNARENGGNPITGQGYKEVSITHSKRRQFQQPLATKLW